MSTIEQPTKVPEQRSDALGTPDRRTLGDLERFRARAQSRLRDGDESSEGATVRPPDPRPAA